MGSENSIRNLLSILKREQNSDEGSFYMVAGLGNPGKEYKLNRHNIGFMALNLFSDRQGVEFSRIERNALVTKIKLAGKRLLLVKPQTFMNRSGQPVASLAKYYKVPNENTMLVYDDIDLALGQIRIRPSGGSGGHRGISSVIENLGTELFPRIRLGIGRPPGKKNAASYVLKDFSKSEQETVQFMLIQTVDALVEYLINGLESAMNKYNSAEIKQ